jgi:Leucine-rich repeat (LRR) protein
MILTATVMPGDAPDKSLIWESSNPGIAEIANGVITAKAPGTSTITVTTVVGRRKATCNLNVLPENSLSMTMTVHPNGMTPISISGVGTVYIDWGDGSAYETHMIGSMYSTNLNHYYSGNQPGMITVIGDIRQLNCNSIHLSGLDVSNNTALTSLNCSGNQLTNLDVSNNAALTSLDCSDNQLANLNVSNNTALISLNCSRNNLSGLSAGNNTVLKSLNCSGNQLTNLDVSNNIALTELNCSGNQLTNLDVSNNTALTTLHCSRNVLSILDVSLNHMLIKLNCSFNELSVTALDDLFEMLPIVEAGSLDIENNPGTADCDKSIAEDKGWTFSMQMILTLQNPVMVNIQLQGTGAIEIDWGDGTFTSSILSYNTENFSHLYTGIVSCTIIISGENITNLQSYNNPVTDIDVSNNPALTYLNCSYNLLTSLDVSNNTMLNSLDCSNNQLTSLDMSNNTVLNNLNCSNNQLSTEALNALFTSLHNFYVYGGYKWISIFNNPGTGTCNRNIATNKGWSL